MSLWKWGWDDNIKGNLNQCEVMNLEILDVCDMFSDWIKLVVGDSQEVCNYFSPDSTL